MSYTGIVVVIPTRNRAAIATNAIRSVLDYAVENVAVLVSDNSTSASERETLAEYCAQRSDSRLRYVRPPDALSMPAHWDWAIHEALRSYAATHFLYLTDRMMFRRGALSEVLRLASLYSHKVITYNQDRIVDNVRPIRVEQCPGTGKLLEVNSLRFTWLLSQAVFHPGLPRMNNSVVPRERDAWRDDSRLPRLHRKPASSAGNLEGRANTRTEHGRERCLPRALSVSAGDRQRSVFSGGPGKVSASER